MDLTPEQHAEIARQREAQKRDQISASRHQETQSKLQQTPEVFKSTISELISFLEDLGDKREISNFPESFKVPEVADVAEAVVELSRSVDSAKVDTEPILDSLKRLESLLEALPKDHAKQKDSIKVSNLKDLAKVLEELNTNVKNIKMVAEAPKVNVDVPAPIVNVKEQDLGPLKTAIENVVDAVLNKEVPEFEATDLEEVEKQLKQSNDFLKKILDKPVGGGGGGGNATPYQLAGKMAYVTLEADGSMPVTLKNTSIPVTLTTVDYATRIDTTTTANMIYIGNAVIGSLNSGAVWQIKRIDKSTLALDKRWADGNALFDNIWDNRASLSYS